MGEANARGSFDDRKQQSREELLDKAEVLLFVNSDGGGLSVQSLPRDEVPDQTSPAVIFVGWLNANLEVLARISMEAYRAHQEAAQDPSVITDVPHRSVILTDGNIARSTDDVQIYVPPTMEFAAASPALPDAGDKTEGFKS